MNQLRSPYKTSIAIAAAVSTLSLSACMNVSKLDTDPTPDFGRHPQIMAKTLAVLPPTADQKVICSLWDAPYTSQLACREPSFFKAHPNGYNENVHAAGSLLMSRCYRDERGQLQYMFYDPYNEPNASDQASLYRTSVVTDTVASIEGASCVIRLNGTADFMDFYSDFESHFESNPDYFEIVADVPSY